MTYDVVQSNKQLHDNVAQKYNTRHPEIYNEREQERIRKFIVTELLPKVKRDGPLRVLDYGAGTGNLTAHFLEQGCNVTALDISQKSLDVLSQRFAGYSSLSPALFDGGITQFADSTFDIVATYSVLHHIPDYLSACAEMARITKPGGLIYIDHEANEHKRTPSQELKNYYALKNTLSNKIRKIRKSGERYEVQFRYGVFVRLCLNKKYRNEGDIHVFPDDHIMRDDVKEVFEKHGARLICENNYLLYDPFVGAEEYMYFSARVSDTKGVIFQKN